LGGTKVKLPAPGPGSHDVPLFPDASPIVPAAAAFSMASGREGGRTVRKARAGPGSYYPRLDLTRTTECCYGFGRSKRVLSEVGKSEVPGHGTPAANLAQGDSGKFDRAPGYGFGSEDKFKTPGVSADGCAGRHSKKPGPGEHNPSDHMSSKAWHGPSYSATPRRDDNTPRRAKADGPGPGEYRCGFLAAEKASPRYGFGTTARPMGCQLKSRSPGPGSYSTSTTTRTGHTTVGGSAPRWSMGVRQEFDLSGVC